MPRRIRFIKDVGEQKVGDVVEKSDVDANILVLIGVAEEYSTTEHRSMEAEDPEEETGDETVQESGAPRLSRRRRKKRYRRRDMQAETLP